MKLSLTLTTTRGLQDMVNEDDSPKVKPVWSGLSLITEQNLSCVKPQQAGHVPDKPNPPPIPTDLNHFPLQKCHNLGVPKKQQQQQQLTQIYGDFLGELRQVEEIYEWVKAGYQAQMEAA